MKKTIIALLALAALSSIVFAQAAATQAPATTPAASAPSSGPAAPAAGAAATDIAAPNANKIGIETAQQKLREVSVDQFEDAGFWDSSISSDEGIVTSRLFEGRPAGSAAEPWRIRAIPARIPRSRTSTFSASRPSSTPAATTRYSSPPSARSRSRASPRRYPYG